jgi:hypothetical protein
MGRAAAKIARAEQALAEAKAARAALDAKPVALEPHRFATYSTIEEMHAAHGGAVLNSGIDPSEAAEAYRRQAEGEQG